MTVIAVASALIIILVSSPVKFIARFLGMRLLVWIGSTIYGVYVWHLPIQSHSVEEFLIAAFEHADLDWREYVEIDQRYCRPAEVSALTGDASKAKARLGWEPTTKFPELVRILVDADIQLLDKQLARGEQLNEHSTSTQYSKG